MFFIFTDLFVMNNFFSTVAQLLTVHQPMDDNSLFLCTHTLPMRKDQYFLVIAIQNCFAV